MTKQRPYRQIAGSLVALVALIVVVPGVLAWAARRRFGSWSPLAGAEPPWSWTGDDAGRALTEQLTDETIVDVIVRVALCVTWLALVVIVVTIVLEAVHMARHGGLARPRVRGLGWSQRIARYVATGLVVITPFLPAQRATAAPASLPSRPPAPVTALHEHAEQPSGPAGDARRSPWAPPVPARRPSDVAGGDYEVRPGDSIYAIAERLTDGDPGRVAEVADRILDLNLGREIGDGQRFTNAAYIEPGWILHLPGGVAAPPSPAEREPGAYVVVPGDTLSGIAQRLLGDSSRWSEIWEVNAGREMGGDRRFDDPHLIFPGWRLTIPHQPSAPAVSDAEPSLAGTGEAPPNATAGDSSIAEPASAGAQPDDVPPVGAVGDDADVAESTPPTVRANDGTSPGGPPATHAPAYMPSSTGRPAPVERSSAPGVPPDSTAPAGAVPPGADPPASPTAPAPGWSPIGLGQAAMLSAGLLALLGVRRRRRLRAALPRARVPEPRPRPAETERLLRSIDAGERLLRVDVAIRSVAAVLASRDRQVAAVLVDGGGDVELILTGPCELPAPWAGARQRWHLPAATPVELLAGAARSVGAPCIALVQLGATADGRDVLVDLEALGVLAVAAAPEVADSVVAGLAATLATSVFAEVAHLVGVGVPHDAFVGHRLYVGSESVDEALELAASVVGTTARATESTFALRSRVAGGESWEPAVVLVSSAHADEVAELGDVLISRGLAVVVAAATEVAPSRLVANGSGWRLEPFGIELVPVGLSTDEVGAVRELVDHAEAPLVDEPLGALSTAAVAPGDPALIEELSDEPYEERDWSLMVRLLGPVEVVDGGYAPASFERSKTKELIAWLCTHRERSTRSGARTALWELDVRDATFANVVSEARRAMARLVRPPDGVEWLARTLTDDLPLHPAVVSDADLVEARLAAARLQPPELAIRTLAPAVDLIRGLPFEGTSYLWPDAEGITSNLVLLATSAAVELGAHYLSMGDIDGVFNATGQGLKVLAGHEELIALRMRAHARTGDHAGIRHEWESYERVLNADPWSDGEPAPKLVSLRRELLSPS